MLPHPNEKRLADARVERVERRDRSRAGRQTFVAGEAHYHSLLRNLRMPARGGSGPRIVGVTRTLGCGKSSVVALNLAWTLARSVEESVLLVGACPENVSINRALSRSSGQPTVSIYSVLHQERTLSDVVMPTREENLFLLPTESVRRNSPPAPAIQRFPNLLEDMRQNYDYVIFDLPVATELSLCLDFAIELDGIILELESNRVRTGEAQAALKQLQFVGAQVLGCVFKET